MLAENAVTGQGLPALGTQVLMNVINEIGALPTNNMQLTQFEGAHNISGEAMLEPRKSDGKPNLTRNGACLPAPLRAVVFPPSIRLTFRFRARRSIRVIPVASSTKRPGPWVPIPASMIWML